MYHVIDDFEVYFSTRAFTVAKQFKRGVFSIVYMYLHSDSMRDDVFLNCLNAQCHVKML